MYPYGSGAVSREGAGSGSQGRGLFSESALPRCF